VPVWLFSCECNRRSIAGHYCSGATHTPVALLHQRDLQATVALLVAIIKRLDEEVLKDLIDPQWVKTKT
jgi:hypothetical protein